MRGRESIRVNQPIFVDYGCIVSLGSGSLIHMNRTLLDTGKITIGENTLLGPDVQIDTAVHPPMADERVYTDESGQSAIHTKTAPAESLAIMFGLEVERLSHRALPPEITL